MKNKLLIVRLVSFFCVVAVSVQADLSYILEPLEAKAEKPVDQVIENQAPSLADEIVATNALPDPEFVKKPLPEKPVEVKVVHLKMTDVMHQLGSLLASTLDLEGELRLLPLRQWKEIVLKSDDYKIEFWGYPMDGLKSNISVSFKVIADEKEVGTWSLPIKCELWRDIYFANQRLNRGVDISPSLLKIQQVDVLRLPQSPVAQGVDLSGYEISANVAVGKPLLWKNITEKPDVRRGKVVEVVAAEGGMRITAKGVALQNGIVSDFISVRNLQSRKDIQAQIINENTVRVHF